MRRCEGSRARSGAGVVEHDGRVGRASPHLLRSDVNERGKREEIANVEAGDVADLCVREGGGVRENAAKSRMVGCWKVTGRSHAHPATDHRRGVLCT